MSLILFHNPRCSKSRETLALLEQRHIYPKIELYLQNTYTPAELQHLADKLGIAMFDK